MEKILKEGWLIKEGGARKNWTKRWFALFDEKIEYSVEKGAHMKGSLWIRDVLVVRSIPDGEYKGKKHIFFVETVARTFYISAADDGERKDWMSAIDGAREALVSKPAAPISPVSLNSEFFSPSAYVAPQPLPPLFGHDSMSGVLPSQIIPSAPRNIEFLILNNKTTKSMERISFAVNVGSWVKEPPPFISAESFGEFASEYAGFVIYKYIVGQSVLPNSPYNYVKCSWSAPGADFRRTYLEEKGDGIHGFFFDLQKLPHNNSVVWQIAEKLAAIPQQPPQQVVSSAMDPREKQIENEIIAMMNKQAEQNMPTLDNRTGVNNYYYVANQWFDQATQARKFGDIETAYILFLKYTTFILHKIPSHLSYNLPRFAEDRSSARARCVKIMKDLESLQRQVIEKKKKEMTNQDMIALPEIPSFPMVPKSQVKQNSRSLDPNVQ